MKNILDNISKNLHFPQHFYVPLLLALIFNGLSWFLLLWRIPSTTELIPLHYYVFFGIDWFGPWIYIFIYPALGLVFFLINIFMACYLATKELFLGKLLIWIGMIMQIFIILNISALIINYFS
ncbi:hypothetical protein KKF32_01800 [Patescibacteria group bacterium]|nr:hypothetical protein [Patescibacteria group bacterium]